MNALVANAALAELPADVDTLVFSALRLTEKKADRRGRATPDQPVAGSADAGSSGAAGAVVTSA